MARILIIGCGYTGVRLAERLQAAGCSVTGTVRSDASARALREAGIAVEPGALDDAQTLARLKALAPAMIGYFVPPQLSARDPLPAVLDAFGPCDLDAFIYASATSVYGDRGGDWVDEDTPVVADGIADAGRIAAEASVTEAAGRSGLPARICRISGIYGPGRTLKGPLQAGHYTLIEGHDPWVGRIHVDDLVTGIDATWRRGRNGCCYNMVDQRPHRASEFANLAADLQSLPRPVTIGETEARERYSPAEFRRKTSSKRIRCSRLVNELGVTLEYPSFEHGLPAAVAADQSR